MNARAGTPRHRLQDVVAAIHPPASHTPRRHGHHDTLTVGDALNVTTLPRRLELGSRGKPASFHLWFGEDNELAADGVSEVVTLGGGLKVRADVEATKVVASAVSAERVTTPSLSIGPPSDRAVYVTRVSSIFRHPVRMEGNLDVVGNELMCVPPAEFRSAVRVGGALDVFGTCTLHSAMRLTSSLETVAECAFKGAVKFSARPTFADGASIIGTLESEAATLNVVRVTGGADFDGTASLRMRDVEGRVALRIDSETVAAPSGALRLAAEGKTSAALFLDAAAGSMRLEGADLCVQEGRRVVTPRVDPSSPGGEVVIGEGALTISRSRIDCRGTRVTNLPPPAEETDAVPLAYVDALRRMLQPPVVRVENEPTTIAGLPKIVFVSCDISAVEVVVPPIDAETPDGWEMKLFDAKRCSDRNPIVVHSAPGQVFGGMLKGHKKIRLNQRGIVLTLIADGEAREWLPMWTTSAGMMQSNPTPGTATASSSPFAPVSSEGMRISRQGSVIISGINARFPPQALTLGEATRVATPELSLPPGRFRPPLPLPSATEEEGEEGKEEEEEEAAVICGPAFDEQGERALKSSILPKGRTEVVLTAEGVTVHDFAAMDDDDEEEEEEEDGEAEEVMARRRRSLIPHGMLEKQASKVVRSTFLTDEQKARLVEEFLPTFMLHRTEPCRPCSFPWILARSVLYETAHAGMPYRSEIMRHPKVDDLMRFWRRQAPDGISSYIVKPCENARETYLDIERADGTISGESPGTFEVRAPVAVHFLKTAAQTVHMRVIFLFPWRGGRAGHYGDVGHVTVELERGTNARGEDRFAATRMCFADPAVPRMSTWVEWHNVRRVRMSQRPMVYLSRETHVPYAAPGTHRRCFGTCADVCDDNGKMWDPAPEVEPPWLCFCGRIGSRGPWAPRVQEWWKEGDRADVKSRWKRMTSLNRS